MVAKQKAVQIEQYEYIWRTQKAIRKIKTSKDFTSYTETANSWQ